MSSSLRSRASSHSVRPSSSPPAGGTPSHLIPSHAMASHHADEDTATASHPGVPLPTMSPSPTVVPQWNPCSGSPVTSSETQARGASSNGLRRSGMVMQLKSATWAADSHGLFDYESRSVHVKILKCNCLREAYHIVRIGTDVQLLSEDQALALYLVEPRSKPLAQLLWANGTYTVGPISHSSIHRHERNTNHEHLWLVVRTLKDRGVGLRAGDVVKLGRYRIKVKEVVVSSLDVRAMGSGRFLIPTEDDDDDDCETEAPDLVELAAANALLEDNGADLECGANLDSGVPNGDVVLEDSVSAVAVEASDATTSPLASCSHDAVGFPGLHPVEGEDSQNLPSSARRLSSLVASNPPRPSKAQALEEDEAGRGKQLDLSSTTAGSAAGSNRRRPIGMEAWIAPTCRICLCGEEEDGETDFNPLVAPCQCKGSMKWVHLQCLRTWMAGRLNITPDNSTMCFFWRSLECELCKVLYPSVVKIVDPLHHVSFENGKEDGHFSSLDLDNVATTYRRMSDSRAYDEKNAELNCRPLKKVKSVQDFRTVELFELPRPELPYIILEPRGQQSRGLHVISLANNKSARLGRGQDTEIRFADISVSRLHAILRFQTPKRSSSAMAMAGSSGISGIDVSEQGCFVIEDNHSKFGTLLEVRKPFRLDPQATIPVSFQVGRTMLTLTIRRRWRFLLPACIPRQSDVSVMMQHGPAQPPSTPAFAARGAAEVILSPPLMPGLVPGAFQMVAGIANQSHMESSRGRDEAPSNRGARNAEITSEVVHAEDEGSNRHFSTNNAGTVAQAAVDR